MGSRFPTISAIGIRNVKRLVKLTVRIPRIENVKPLQSLVISLPSLRPHRLSSERHLVGLDHLSAAGDILFHLIVARFHAQKNGGLVFEGKVFHLKFLARADPDARR